MTASVPPDREAAVQQVAHEQRWAPHAMSSSYWCPVCTSIGLHPENYEAIEQVIGPRRFEDGKAEGRREAAEAIDEWRIEYEAESGKFFDGAYCEALEVARDLARGAQQPDEKERTDGQ